MPRDTTDSSRGLEYPFRESFSTMIHRGVLAIIAVIVAVMPLSCTKRQTLTVSAAASLRKPLLEIGRLFDETNRDLSLVYNFAGSGSLQEQIRRGAPVDIFIAAGNRPIDLLEAEGLIQPGNRRDLLTNRLVLVAPRNNNLVNSFDDLASPRTGHIAVGAFGSVPAGQYAEETLRNLGLLEAVRPKLIYAKSVLQVLAYVESGNVDAGLVYLTDAARSPHLRLIGEAPAGVHSPIIYQAAAIRDGFNPAAAQAFLDFLDTDSAREVFQAYGFELAEN